METAYSIREWTWACLYRGMTKHFLQPNETPFRRAALVILLTATLGLAADRKVAPDLKNLSPDQAVNVIVRYSHPPQQQHRLTAERHGGKLKRNLELVNSAAYSVPASSLEALSQDPDVDYIAPDRPVASTLDYANPAVNAGIARQYGFTGSGVPVAVIDSGIMNSHPDLMDSAGKSRVVYSE